jgi:hypothetical protein
MIIIIYKIFLKFKNDNQRIIKIDNKFIQIDM